MSSWKFADPPNVAVIANRKVVSGQDWIAYVFHDAEDGGWQFLNREPPPLSEGDAAVVGLKQIVDLDRTIEELADLPLGWSAHRLGPTSPWIRTRIIA